MTVKNTLSTTASPFTHPQTAAQVTGQRTKLVRTLVAITNGDSATSTFFLAEVPDIAVVKSVTLEGPTCTGATDCDIGLFDMAGNAKLTGNSAADYYADGLDLSTSTSLPIGDFGGYVWRAGSRSIGSTSLQEVYLDAGDVIGPVPATGSTIKGTKYQIGLTLNQAATQTKSYIATVEYQCAE